MEQLIPVRCKNNNTIVNIPAGTKLTDVYAQTGLQLIHGPISARVNNKVEGMHYRIYKQKEVEFLDITSSSALRAYTRSLFFVL